MVAPLMSSFKVLIGMNHAPYFKPNITEIISIQMTNATQRWSFQLPSFLDDDLGDVVTLSVDFGSASNFIQLKEAKYL